MRFTLVIITRSHLAVLQLYTKDVGEEKENLVLRVVYAGSSDVALHATNSFDLAYNMSQLLQISLDRGARDTPVGVPSWRTPNRQIVHENNSHTEEFALDGRYSP
jgi:hypothetical protein